jgi:hypothetical protein
MAIQYPNPQLSLDLLAAAERTKQNPQKGVNHSDIYIDAKQGTVPLTCLYDCANNLLRMSKDGQRVIIQNHSAKGSMIITLTRVSMGNFKEEVNFDIPPASK